MTQSCSFRFASARTANRLVAGVPAAARLARSHAVARPGEALVIAFEQASSGDEGLAPRTLSEIARLAPGVKVIIAERAAAAAIPAETLPDAATIATLPRSATSCVLPSPDAALDAAGRAIIRNTAKPGDGLISRHVNRPLSQAISARLLRLSWIRPGHASALTALAALAMLACLVAFPSPAGLAAAAVLFQLASVIDGVDGEIARATHRTSRLGASLDSLIDAFTNCAFLAGAGISFAMQDDPRTAMICAAATMVQIAGLTILGWRAWLREGVVHFDGAKAVANTAPAGLGTLVKDLTSRDFYCFAFMLAALCGLLPAAMTVFLAGSAIWLAFVIAAAGLRLAGAG